LNPAGHRSTLYGKKLKETEGNQSKSKESEENMRRPRLWTAIVLAAVTLTAVKTAAADTLIYNNAVNAGATFVPGSSIEIFDWGTSSGGLISKLTFGYSSTSVTPTVKVRFYGYFSTTYFETGYPIKQLTLSNLPSTGGMVQYYTYVLPEADRFVLSGGSFGYSVECVSSTMRLVLASGGAGNVNELWEYIYDWLYGWGWYPFWFGGSPWAGLYMKVYTAPPISEVTCNINGNKFNDLNGNGVWNVGEPAMTGWEFYLDLNNNGTRETSEPNVVTDPNGFYEFVHMPSPATYTLREIQKDGWTQTLPGQSGAYKYTVVTDPNTTYGPFNFGNGILQNNAIIAGSVFHDLNGSSVRDAGEPGQSTWRVYIDANHNGLYDSGEPTALTNASGNYQLTQLAAGVYTVAEVLQNAWVQTYPTTACTHTVTVSTSSQTVSNIHFGNHTFTTYGGGSGTQGDPYRIASHLHLQALGAHWWDWGRHFVLTADIDLSKYKGEEFNLIGRYNFADQYIPFSGTFDGAGYTLSHFTYTYKQAPQEFIGLFGYVDGADARLSNIHLRDVAINTLGNGVDSGALVGWLKNGTVEHCSVEQGSVTINTSGVGGLVGYFYLGTIRDCYADVTVSGANGIAGGLVGSSYDGLIQGCTAQGLVTGKYDCGGLIGSNGGQIRRCSANAQVSGFRQIGGLAGSNNGLLEQSFSTGSVQGTSQDAGGLVGRELGEVGIFDCYSLAQVSGVSNVGGLVGLSWADPTNPYVITHSWSAGRVTGSSYVGGLVGRNIDTLATACVWDTQTSTRATSAAGTGKTTAQMQTPGTFAPLGWDMQAVWRMCQNGAYPKFTWEWTSAADFVCPDGTAIGDFAFFAHYWQMAPCGLGNFHCDGADLDRSGGVELADLLIFVESWLAASAE
jgi:hypothetical protein